MSFMKPQNRDKKIRLWFCGRIEIYNKTYYKTYNKVLDKHRDIETGTDTQRQTHRDSPTYNRTPQDYSTQTLPTSRHTPPQRESHASPYMYSQGYPTRTHVHSEAHPHTEP